MFPRVQYEIKIIAESILYFHLILSSVNGSNRSILTSRSLKAYQKKLKIYFKIHYSIGCSYYNRSLCIAFANYILQFCIPLLNFIPLNANEIPITKTFPISSTTVLRAVSILRLNLLNHQIMFKRFFRAEYFRSLDRKTTYFSMIRKDCFPLQRVTFIKMELPFHN